MIIKINNSIERFRLCAKTQNHAFIAQPCSFNTRCVEAGLFVNSATGRIGRGAKFPLQLGHTPFSTSVAQAVQKVHSNVQITASVDSGGKS